MPEHEARPRLLPVYPGNQPVAGYLTRLSAPGVYQPEVALINDRDELPYLAGYGIGRPDRRLRFQARKVGGRKEAAAI